MKPVYKTDDPFNKTNWRPISILSVICKAFERCLYDQIYKYKWACFLIGHHQPRN